MICKIKEFFYGFILNENISGHSFVEIETNKKEQTLMCEICGEISVGKL